MGIYLRTIALTKNGYQTIISDFPLTTVSRFESPTFGQIGYLKDQTAGDIVWPPDAQLNCHPLPWTYAVIAVEEQEVVDLGVRTL